MAPNLTPEKALIFRIVHVDSIEWILGNGLHCETSATRDSHYRAIGNPELIERRQRRIVPLPPGGTLSDYVPFYFTPYSPMLYNIHTGHGGIARQPNMNIAFLVSSLHRLIDLRLKFVISDRHAYLQVASFFQDLSELACLPWSDWQSRNFKRDPDGPERFERYQAEALVHRCLPVEALLGIVVYTQQQVSQVKQMADDGGLKLKVLARPSWYF